MGSQMMTVTPDLQQKLIDLQSRVVLPLSDLKEINRQADLRGIKLEYARKGVKIYAAAIGEDRPRIERIYGDGYLDITNLQELPVMLTNLIVRSLPR